MSLVRAILLGLVFLGSAWVALNVVMSSLADCAGSDFSVCIGNAAWVGFVVFIVLCVSGWVGIVLVVDD